MYSSESRLDLPCSTSADAVQGTGGHDFQSACLVCSFPGRAKQFIAHMNVRTIRRQLEVLEVKGIRRMLQKVRNGE